jgi:hypothetical protein
MRQMFPIKGETFRYTTEDIIKHQLQFFHGPERIKYKHIPKVMDLCLVKLYQLVESTHYEAYEILDSFILNDDVKKKFEHEEEISELKDCINKGDWDSFISHCHNPKVIAQLFLDFCETLAAPVITIANLREVNTTFQKSFHTFNNEEENVEKKALYEIFEDDAKVNTKKVTFYVI